MPSYKLKKMSCRDDASLTVACKDSSVSIFLDNNVFDLLDDDLLDFLTSRIVLVHLYLQVLLTLRDRND